MKKVITTMITVSICGLLWINIGIPVIAAASSAEETQANRTHQIIVQYRKSAPDHKIWQTSIAEKISNRDKLSVRTELIQLDDETQVSSMLETLKKDKDVLYAEDNTKLMLHSVPNDPYYSQQWGLSKIAAPSAWDIIPSTGSAVVAVIDSGITSTHADLKNRITSGSKSFLDNGSSNVYDSNGHGTEVAGVIAAEFNNSVGICGVAGASNVKILPLKTAAQDGTSYLSDVIAAIDYAISADVDVINLSMGSTEPSDIENAAIQRAIHANIVVVASAGNDKNSTYEYPASYDNVISVGSIAKDGIYSYFSNYNNKIDLVAPGEDIYTCTNRGSYAREDGTSFSAPMVSAAAAVLKSIDSSLTPGEIENILTSTAVDYGTSGRDNHYGYGVLNFYKAVNMISQSSSVTGVSLSTASVNLMVGSSTALTCSVLPGTAINKTVSWTSDNTDVATVDSAGLVTAITPGEATITVTTEDGGYSASAVIEVYGDISASFDGTQWEAKTDIPANHEWTILFSKVVETRTLNQQNIYVTDHNGKAVSVTVNADSDGKSAMITPNSFYQSGQSYYLFIRNISSSVGDVLSKAVRMQFTIE